MKAIDTIMVFGEFIFSALFSGKFRNEYNADLGYFDEEDGK
mgnify:CR=1 FL=1